MNKLQGTANVSNPGYFGFLKYENLPYEDARQCGYEDLRETFPDLPELEVLLGVILLAVGWEDWDGKGTRYLLLYEDLYGGLQMVDTVIRDDEDEDETEWAPVSVTWEKLHHRAFPDLPPDALRYLRQLVAQQLPAGGQ